MDGLTPIASQIDESSRCPQAIFYPGLYTDG